MKFIHGVLLSHTDFCNSLNRGLLDSNLRMLQLNLNMSAIIVVGMPWFSEKKKPWHVGMPRFFFSDAMVRLLKFRVTATSVQLRSTGSNQLEEPMLSRLVSEEKSLQFASRRDQSSIKISKC